MDLNRKWYQKFTLMVNDFENTFIDLKDREEIKFDILQGLYSDDLTENTKHLLLLLIQEKVDTLIGSVDSAEQVVGSLINVFRSIGNSHVFIKSQILRTSAAVCLYYSLKERKPQSFDEYTALLLDIVFKSSNHSHPLIVNAGSNCLEEIERFHKGFTYQYLENLKIAIDNCRAFHYSGYLNLLGEIIKSTSNPKLQGIEADDRVEVFNETLKCRLFLLQQTNVMSPTGLLKLIPKGLKNTDAKNIPKSEMMALFMYCIQSSDLLLIYLAYYIQVHCGSYLQVADEYQYMMLVAKMLTMMEINQIATIQKAIVNNLLTNTVKSLQSDSTREDAFMLAAPTLNPTIYKPLDVKLQRIGTMFAILKFCNISIQEYMQVNILQCLQYHLVHDHLSNKQINSIFRKLWLLYENASDVMKENILALLGDVSERSFLAASQVVVFCRLIKHTSSSAACNILTYLTKQFVQYQHNPKSSWKPYLQVLSQLLVDEDIYPMMFLERFNEWMETGMLQQISFQEGNLLLSLLARILLIHHKYNDVKYKIASILWDLSQNCDNCSIVDLALFYYKIIGYVSPRFYQDIFDVPISKLADPSNEMRKGDTTEKITSIRGGMVLKKVRQNFLKIEQIKSFDPTTDDEVVFEKDIKNSENILDSYADFICSECCDKTVTLKFRLSIMDRVAEECPEELFGINLIFSTDRDTCEIKTTPVPYLKKPTSTSTEHTVEDFTVILSPWKPQQTDVKIRATYFDASCQCWTCNLDDYVLLVKYLFKPIPFIQKEEDKQKFFEELWDIFKWNQKSRLNENVEAVISVKCLYGANWDFIQEQLNKYLMYKDGDEYCFGIFLPPKNHLLLKCTMNDNDMVIHYSTDYFDIIDRVDDYLASLQTT